MQIQANLENYNTYSADNCFPRYTIFVDGKPISVNHTNLRGRLVRTADQLPYANVKAASAYVLNTIASAFGAIFRIQRNDSVRLSEIRSDNLATAFPFEFVVYFAISRTGKQAIGAKVSSIYNASVVTQQEIQVLKSIEPALTQVQCKRVLANNSYTVRG